MKLFCIFTFFLLSFCIAKADTIDYWHVFHNKKKIAEFNKLACHEIILKHKEIKSGDVLVINYFRDTPCNNCSTSITVEDDNHQIYLSGTGKGTLNPISVKLDELLKLSKSSGKHTFVVFFREGENRDSVLLFRLKIE